MFQHGALCDEGISLRTPAFEDSAESFAATLAVALSNNDFVPVTLPADQSPPDTEEGGPPADDATAEGADAAPGAAAAEPARVAGAFRYEGK